MPVFQFTQPVQQLEKRKGGYFYFKIDAQVVEQFERKRATRLICAIEGSKPYSCGLNHHGDGHFFVIVAGKIIKGLKKELGDPLTFKIYEDPNPLGVAMPEVLEVFLEQSPETKEQFEKLTDGKKRSLIHSIAKVKSLDLQVSKIQDFFLQVK